MAIREIAAKPPKEILGSIVKSRFGDIVIVSRKMGRKYWEYKWAKVSDPSSTGWIKLTSSDAAYFFSKYAFVRLATPKEMKAGESGVQARQTEKYTRVYEAKEELRSKEILPGDVVKVKYSNTTKDEAVLQVDYRTGQVAIVRQYESSAQAYTKRRLLPIKICTKVADGGGSFNPNNPLYAKHYIHIPDFYKKGGIVAPRRAKRRWDSF